ncbi:MAG TPA: ferrochelatase [Vicinamibacterales bacterium]|nr:ferrochelatase [Vicinamibacterales bacterium]
MAGTRHVILVTYGEPPTPAFGAQLVYSWRILLGLTRTVAPIPRPLVPIIALARARRRQQSWTAYGYQSPLEPITERQAGRLRDTLAETGDGRSWRVHVAYEFRRPLLAEVLDAIARDEPVWVAPMYAAESAFTHALSRGTADKHEAATARGVRVLDALDADALADLSAAHVLEHTRADDRWRGSDVALVLAAHGTVLDPPRPIDTGLAATEALRQAITERLADHFGMVVNGWLNHTRGGQWTDPPIETTLERVANAGYSRLVYFPYGFLADNAESELEGRVALERHDAIEALHLPCLNDSSALAEALARQIGATAAGPAVEAGVLPR